MVLPSLLLALTACEESPTGRKQVTLVPDKQMEQIGSRTFAELPRSRTVVEDPRILGYVSCITRALVNALVWFRRAAA
jgi:predicted Zn-dependent protease